jgi:hypothetical protein
VKFYIGFDSPSYSYKCHVPYFISARTVINRKKPLFGDWIMDSGGFSELSIYGEYTITEDKYVEAIKRLNPSASFCQDWMVEPMILSKTGGTVKSHQLKTIESYINLTNRVPNMLPVLQGQSIEDYLSHIDMYKVAGVNLDRLFGLGSVCRRQSTKDIVWIINTIKAQYPNMQLHGFGVKTTALKDGSVTNLLDSCDSMAWSFNGRHTNLHCDGCLQKHCAHCVKYAIGWREQLLQYINQSSKYHQNVMELVAK